VVDDFAFAFIDQVEAIIEDGRLLGGGWLSSARGVRAVLIFFSCFRAVVVFFLLALSTLRFFAAWRIKFGILFVLSNNRPLI